VYILLEKIKSRGWACF